MHNQIIDLKKTTTKKSVFYTILTDSRRLYETWRLYMIVLICLSCHGVGYHLRFYIRESLFALYFFYNTFSKRPKVPKEVCHDYCMKTFNWFFYACVCFPVYLFMETTSWPLHPLFSSGAHPRPMRQKNSALKVKIQP